MDRFNIYKFLLIGSLILISQSCKQDNVKEKQLRNVVVAQVLSLSDTEEANYPGVIEEGASISASFMADGKIGKILVKEGDRVRKGQLLAALEDTDYLIGLSQVEAQYNQMTKEKERMDAMYEKHNIAPNDYEKFQAGYEQLKLQLEMVKRKVDYTRLLSPSDGYIATKYLNVGELVGAGTPVFNIIDDSSLKASVDLPVSIYLKKDKINSVQGFVPGIANAIPLSIASFTPDADNNMLYRMKLSIPSRLVRELTPGMNISILLNVSDDVTAESLVPSRSIFKDEGKTYVWVLSQRDSTIYKKEVTVEGAPKGKMSVVKGLNDGENIVETGVRQLYEGEKVNVLKRAEIGL